MRAVADDEPLRIDPGCAVIAERGANSVAAVHETELDAQHGSRCAAVTEEDHMCIAARHRDRVRLEIEACPVARFSGRLIVDDVDGCIVVNHDLEAIVSDQSSRSAHTQVTALGHAR